MAIPTDINDRTHRSYRQDPNNENQTVVASINLGGLGIENYDYIDASQTTSSDTFVFKSGGSSGSTIATIVVNYTDGTKENLLSVEKS